MPIKDSTFPAAFWWRPAAWLRVTGDDSANFLQGQFTNDLRSATPEKAVYGLWLNVKGKVIADSFVLRAANSAGFWIASYFSAASAIRERLESHAIADDVVIEDETEGWRAVSLLGEAAAERAREARAGGVAADGFLFRGRRTREGNAEWLFPASAAEAVRAALSAAGLRELDEQEIVRRRIAAAIPAVPADIGPGDLPNEAALEDDALSYTKGCYLGQEVMARLKSMGQVRRRLLRVEGEGEIPALPAPLFVGARQVGELRSAVRTDAGRFIGLAMLSLLHTGRSAQLALAANLAPTIHLTDPT